MNLQSPEQKYRRKPTKTYCGLSIILASPSRFDTKELLSGYAGSFFRDCLSPINLNQCDLRLASDNSELLPNTKVVLLLGSSALRRYIPEWEFTINEVRGCPLIKDSIIYIASYFPQDAMDMKASYEKDYNKFLETESEDSTGDYDDTDTTEKTTHGKTARSNYKFWLEADVSKAKKLLNPKYRELVVKQQSYANFQLFPPLAEAIKVLNEARGDLYLDIETDSCLNLTCVGFATSESLPDIYVVPVKRFDSSLAYEDLPLFLKALSMAMQRCCVVIHNSGFDLLVLAAGFSVGIPRKNYDTMLAAHRLNVDAEKSLGHCVSLYTFMPYHKSEGVFEPKNEAQELQLWRYNAKDIAVMPIIKEAQLELAKLRRAESSINQVNDSIYSYMLMTLSGIKIDPVAIKQKVDENDRWMNQILRILNILIGHPLLPTSSKQCVEYFHTELGIPVAARSRKTGAPSLDEKAFWKLALKNDHPTIPLILNYRQTKKETGTLLSNPWNLNDSRAVYPGWKEYYQTVRDDKEFTWL